MCIVLFLSLSLLLVLEYSLHWASIFKANLRRLVNLQTKAQSLQSQTN